MAKPQSGSRKAIRPRAMQAAGVASVVGAMLALGPITGAPVIGTPAVAEASPRKLPAPPANGEMGFIVERFVQAVIQEKEACPTGIALKTDEAFYATLPPAERERLMKPENTAERERRWKAYAMGPNGSNICTNPDMFDHAMIKSVQSPRAWGLDLDGGDKSDTCGHKEFVSPTGETGIDNQEYRAMGCAAEWRGVDGIAGDLAIGSANFHKSGEWTQVVLLRGVDSLERDDDVEVIYGNTADRPVLDSKGKWLRGVSYSVTDKFPRHRNVLKGSIRNGVLTTEPTDIKLSWVWGQGGGRDLRGVRAKYDFRKGRMRLTFQPDGSITGLVAGYRPVFDNVIYSSLGGVGGATTAKIDCAGVLKAVQAHADGLKNPKTGKCEGISAAYQLGGIPAFIADEPNPAKVATR